MSDIDIDIYSYISACIMLHTCMRAENQFNTLYAYKLCMNADNLQDILTLITCWLYRNQIERNPDVDMPLPIQYES